MNISTIEDEVAAGNMSAAQCFTKMREHLDNYDETLDLLAWADDEGAKVCWVDHSMGDTGDFSTVWVCETEDRKGYGDTFADCIADAIKEKTDPTKWDYEPKFEDAEVPDE
jgi:hypothetical protein